MPLYLDLIDALARVSMLAKVCTPLLTRSGPKVGTDQFVFGLLVAESVLR